MGIDFTASEPDVRLGSAFFELVNRPHRWVHRRVESLRFVDASSVARQVSIDFSLGSEFIEAPPEPLVPLAILVKRPLVSLDVWAEDDAPLPVLTRRENGFVTWSMMVAKAEQLLGIDPGGLPPSIAQDLRQVALAEPNVALDLASRFVDPSLDAVEARRGLVQLGFTELLRDFASNFLLIVQLDEIRDERRVMKFRYLEPLEPPEGLIERAAQQLGWLVTSFDFHVPAIGESGSYHFQVEAPSELAIDEAFIAVAVDDDVSVHPSRIAGQNAHLYVDDVPASASGLVSVWLKQPRVGLLRLSAASALLTASVMTYYALNLERVHPGIASSLLLTIPGLIALIAASPREHRLASYFFFGVRILTAIAGLLAYVGALTLGIGTPDDRSVGFWQTITFLSWGCFILLTLSYFSLEPIIDTWGAAKSRLFGKEPDEG